MVIAAFLCVIITQARQVELVAPLAIGLTASGATFRASQATGDRLARIEKFRGPIPLGLAIRRRSSVRSPTEASVQSGAEIAGRLMASKVLFLELRESLQTAPCGAIVSGVLSLGAPQTGIVALVPS